MYIKKYLKPCALPIFFALCGAAIVSCADDIELGKPVDEGAYQGVTRVDGRLFDEATNRNQTVVELRAGKAERDVYFSLTRLPGKGVDVKIEVDPAYVAAYNAEHNTAFEPFPAASVALENDGVLLLAPDELRSTSVGVTLTDDPALVDGQTYVLPLRATSVTDGITLAESAGRTVFLVKPVRGESVDDTDKGKDAVKTVLYFEVNDTNPLNALEFVLKDSGKLFFDEVVLFSANINYNAEQGRVYVYNNPNVQFLLDNNEQFLQPLRKRGIKVILGILGNWDAAGVAQLSDAGARQFAQELAAYCYAYDLDGVGFDDEYSNAPDLSNPLFTYPSQAAASRLLYETKKAMPDKTVMVYYLTNIQSSIPAVDGVLPGEFVDYAVADYGLAARPMQGMTLKNCSGMSSQLRQYGWSDTEANARAKKQEGYGYWMFFALDPNYYGSQVSRCQNVCKGLYDEELLYPTHYYKKNDATRYAF